MENENNITIQIDGFEPKKRPKRKVKPEIEDAALSIVGKFLPTELRASPKTLEIAYERGYILYNAGKFQDALAYFAVLIPADPDNPKYIFGRAACHHMLHEYKEAINFYTAAAIIDPESPLPFYYSADCFLKMHDPFGALITLDIGLKRSHHPKYSKIIERMGSMVRQLEHELGEKKAQSSQSFINPT
jgi:type III secretion system low calcium response chaperone LcrH/SycD